MQSHSLSPISAQAAPMGWEPHGPHACAVDREVVLAQVLEGTPPGRHREMIIREMEELGVGQPHPEGLLSDVWQTMSFTSPTEQSNATGWFEPNVDPIVPAVPEGLDAEGLFLRAQ